MKIIKSTESIPVEHPVFCLFGQPGICKTSLGYSAKDPLVLDFDGGAYRAVNRRDTAQINTWADTEGLADELAHYSTVIVDTAGRCIDLMTIDIIDKNPKYGRDGNLTLQGYGVLKSRFRTWMTQLRAMGKDVVLISHQKEDKDGDITVARPDITGSSCGEVLKISDIVGYVYMSGRDRLVDFNPTDRWFGKNPAGWKPLKVPPPEKATTFLAELIDKGRVALGSISEESAKVVQQVEEFRLHFDTLKTLEEINKELGKGHDLAAILKPQVKTLLVNRAKALGFTWDIKNLKFAEAEKVSA